MPLNLPGILDSAQPIPGTPADKWGYRRNLRAGYLIMTDEEYLAFPAVNASLIKCPTLSEMHSQLTAPPQDTEALAQGTLTDMAILTPEKDALERFQPVDVPLNTAKLPGTDTPRNTPFGRDTKQGKEAYAAAAVEHPGKHLVSIEEYRDLSEDMAENRAAFYRHPICLRQARLEWHTDPAGIERVRRIPGAAGYQLVGILWHPQWECWCKWKPDILPYRPDPSGYGIPDLKTTRQHPLAFMKDVFQFGYLYQARWYKECHEITMRLLGLPMVVTHWEWLIVSKEIPDDKKKPRRAMARALRLPFNAELFKPWDRIERSLFPADGMGRVERFCGALREHISAGASPDIERIWTAYEDDAEPFIPIEY